MNSSYLYRFILLALLGVISWSCSSVDKEQEYKGLKYTLRKKGTGEQLNDSSIVQVHMKLFTSKDSLLQDSYSSPLPMLLNLRDTMNSKISLVEVLKKGQVGDSVTILIHSDTLMQGQPRPPFIEEGSYLRYEFKIVKSMTYPEFLTAQQDAQKKQAEMQQKAQQEYMQKMMEKQMEMQRQSDSVSVGQVEYIENTYFKEKGIKNFKKTESGLFYKIDKQGKTDIETGDNVKVNYEGTLLTTGEKFDSSFDRGEAFEFPIGQGQVIRAWDEGIPLIGRGGKGYLYIPSNLAYGVQGQGKIPSNAMLVFKVEVMENVTKGQSQQGQSMQGGGR